MDPATLRNLGMAVLERMGEGEFPPNSATSAVRKEARNVYWMSCLLQRNASTMGKLLHIDHIGGRNMPTTLRVRAFCLRVQITRVTLETCLYRSCRLKFLSPPLPSALRMSNSNTPPLLKYTVYLPSPVAEVSSRQTVLLVR